MIPSDRGRKNHSKSGKYSKDQNEVTHYTLNPAKKLSEEYSLNSEEYARIFRSMPAPACITSIKDGRIVEVNDTFCHETGYSRSELVGRTTIELEFFAQPEDREQIFQMFQDAGINSNEITFRLKSGEFVPFLTSISLFEMAESPCALTIIQDLREQVKIKKELQETAIKFRTLFENSRDAIGVSKTGIHAYVNAAYLELFGYPSFDELDGRPLFDVIAPDSRDQMREIVQKRSLSPAAPTLYETRGLRKDGSEFDMEIQSSTYELDGERYTVGLLRNITERKKVEAQLRISEEKYRSVVENAQEGIISYDSAWRITFANVRGETIFGYEQGEMLGRPITDIVLDEDHPYHEERKKKWESGLQGTYEGCYKKKDGSVVWLQVSGWTVTNNGRFAGVSTLITDITERKQVEKALLKNETRFRRALEAASAVPYYHDFKTNTYAFIGDGIFGLTGFTAQEMTPALFGSLQSDEHLIGDESSLTIKEASELMKAGKLRRWRSDSYLTRRDGNKLWIADTSVPIFDDIGKVIGSMGFLQDFTERKQMEATLRENEEKFKYVFDHSVIGKTITFPDGRLNVNQSFCNMMGYSIDELNNDIWQRITYPDDVEASEQEAAKLLSGEKDSTRFVKRYIHKNGSTVWADIGIALRRDSQGNPLYFITSVLDITERKKAEDALRESEKYFQAAFHTGAGAFYIVNEVDGLMIDVNEQFLKLYGYTRDEVIGKTSLELGMWAVPENRKALLAELALHDFVNDFEALAQRKTGETFYCLGSVRKLKKAGKSLLLGVIHDITERKRAENELYRLNREFRAISDCNGILVRADDEQTLHQDICHIICEETGYRMAWVGYAEDDEAKTVRPIAWAGYEAGYLASANIVWSDSTYGQGPIGTAIRTGQCVYSHDFENDPQLAPWRERALERGYRSIIALPLQGEHNKIFGALTIYSSEVNAFTLTERRLLEELASDLAFGINVLRARTEQRRAEELLRRSETQLRDAQQIAHIGSSYWDAITNQTTWSDEMYRITGWDPSRPAPTREERAKLYTPKSYDLFNSIVTHTLNTGEPYDLELEIIRPDGSLRQVEARGAALYDDHGAVIALHGTLQDITERKLAEIALRTSEENYRSLVENSVSAIAVLDRNGYILYANPAGKKVWNDPQIIGKNIFDIYPDEYARRYDLAIKQVIDTQTTIQDEVESPISGQHMWFRISMSPLKNLDGIANTLLLNAWDITESKQAEGKVIWLASFPERNPNPVVEIDSLGVVFYMNPAAQQQFPNLRTEGFNHPWLLGLERVFSTLKPEEISKYQREIQIDNIWYMQSFSYVVEVARIRIYALEITGSKQAEETIRNQNQVLLTLHSVALQTGAELRLTPLLANVLAQSQTLLNADRGGGVYLYESDEQVLRLAHGTGINRGREGVTLQIGEGIAGRVYQKAQALIVDDYTHWDGRTTVLINEPPSTVMGVPLFAQNKVIGVLTFVANSMLRKFTTFDVQQAEMFAAQVAIAIQNAQLYRKAQDEIAERIKAENELRLLNEELELRVEERTTELNHINIELEHANRAKDEFLANMSHELRSPLNGILGMSEILLGKIRGPLNESQEKYVKLIDASGRHLLSLINDILDISKIEAGKFEIHPEQAGVSEVCQASLTFVKEIANRKSINLEFYPDPAATTFVVDPKRMKQILVNLLTNAVKFTPEQGKVVLKVHGEPEQGQIQISVTDTGIGIAPADLERLFQPFAQVDSSLTREQEGTGLGLVLIRALTELHGGGVEVESEVGKGSRFTITLPWEPVGENTKSEIRPDTEPLSTNVLQDSPMSKGVILIAEDNPTNAQVVNDFLESCGYQIFVAHNGVQALEMADTLMPDLILMDIQMPVMDGLEATRRLRQNPKFKGTPIIALTALAMVGDRERCLAAGANEYIVKPMSLKNLENTIFNLLEKKG